MTCAFGLFHRAGGVLFFLLAKHAQQIAAQVPKANTAVPQYRLVLSRSLALGRNGGVINADYYFLVSIKYTESAAETTATIDATTWTVFAKW